MAGACADAFWFPEDGKLNILPLNPPSLGGCAGAALFKPENGLFMFELNELKLKEEAPLLAPKANGVDAFWLGFEPTPGKL